MAVTVNVTTDQPEYVIGDLITATVLVDGADPGSSKAVTINAVATVDGIQVQSPPVTFSVIDPPAEIVYESVTSDDPAITFTQADPPNVFTAPAA